MPVYREHDERLEIKVVGLSRRIAELSKKRYRFTANWGANFNPYGIR
ncbi:hypothetical protein ACYULU_03325 [Breznakiellaceae bacterium SP9]